MKTAEEIANEIMNEFYVQFGYVSSSNKDQVALIAQAIESYAAERAKEAIENAFGEANQYIRKDFHDQYIQKARSEALEEAAKICDGRQVDRYSSDCAVEAGYMAAEIRALKK